MYGNWDWAIACKVAAPKMRRKKGVAKWSSARAAFTDNRTSGLTPAEYCTTQKSGKSAIIPHNQAVNQESKDGV
jgi:hypothetical protein